MLAFDAEASCVPRMRGLLQVQVPDDVGRQLCLLEVRLPDGYPTTAQPQVELHARKLDSERKERLLSSLHDAMDGWKGETCLFQIVEWIRECKDEWFDVDDVTASSHATEPSVSADQADALVETRGTCAAENASYLWHTGEPLTDRRSTFQAHLVELTDPDRVSSALDALCTDRKIRVATHNIFAYRIALSTGGYASDSDDDGEAAAGGRLLHLLQLVDARDVLVVVSRWYGGTPLGPDRFKRISQVARDVLDRHGHVRPPTRRP